KVVFKCLSPLNAQTREQFFPSCIERQRAMKMRCLDSVAMCCHLRALKDLAAQWKVHVNATMPPLALWLCTAVRGQIRAR
ncbi:unnamed protein product, partial [Citrullus colocynthis]